MSSCHYTDLKAYQRSSAQSSRQTQEGIDLKVDVTIFGATNLPLLKTTLWGKERRIFAAVTDGTQTKKTKPIQSEERVVYWNEEMDDFIVPQFGYIKLSLYAEHHLLEDEIIGSIKIRAEPRTKALFRIANNFAPDLTVVLTVVIHEPIRATKEAIASADKALTGLHILNEWKGVVESVQWVMGKVGDLADFNPYAQMAWKALTLFPKVLLAQFEYDENILALVKAMRNAFELSQAEALLKAIQPNSNQALIIKLLLRHLKLCSDVIQRYAKDQEFSKRLMKNLTGKINTEVQGLCETLAKLRQDLLDNAAINTQIAVACIQASVEMFPKQISDIVGPITLVRKLDSLSLAKRAPENRPAHEIALRFRLGERLGSYFSFSRNEKSKRKEYHLFTTIIHDLANHYPSFKTALGTLIRDNKPLRVATDYDTLFNTLILGSLKTVDADIPILIIIDGLDESGNVHGKHGLAAFLSHSLNKLPSFVRVLITSRLDSGLKVWFANAQRSQFDVLEMNDPKLAAKTGDDIRTYFHAKLRPDIFKEYGTRLVAKSEGLFQWAAVACAYIDDPPFAFTEADCLRGLLNEAGDGENYTQTLLSPLYELYHGILSRYLDSDVAKSRFCSVMGHLLSASEPLSINSLIQLRHYMPGDHYDDDSVVAIFKHLGSLLSNVTEDNRNLPIVPLHTSFRDFLTDKDLNHRFFIDIGKAHNELTHACIDLMISKLEFNICKLESSHLRNSEVSDLKGRINRHIQPSLFYACRYWDDHLARVPFGPNLFEKL